MQVNYSVGGVGIADKIHHTVYLQGAVTLYLKDVLRRCFLKREFIVDIVLQEGKVICRVSSLV